MESIKMRLKESLKLIEEIENAKNYYEANESLAQLDRTFLDLRKMTAKYSKIFSYEKFNKIQKK